METFMHSLFLQKKLNHEIIKKNNDSSFGSAINSRRKCAN